MASLLSVTCQAQSLRVILAVHYTHATATFAASFLLRLARLL